MPYRKRIVCLANSDKPGGYCVAGREYEGRGFGGWVRPVSDRSGEEISFMEQKLADGSTPKLLDIIEIPLEEPRPRACQTENHLIARGQRWEKVGEFPRHELLPLCDDIGQLWINGQHSSRGTNDRISDAEASTLDTSLVLIQPEVLSVSVIPNPWEGKRQARAAFRYRGKGYDLVLTDPSLRRHFLSLGEGEHRYTHPAVLCVSLAGPLEGCWYKLVAAIIDL